MPTSFPSIDTLWFPVIAISALKFIFLLCVVHILEKERDEIKQKFDDEMQSRLDMITAERARVKPSVSASCSSSCVARTLPASSQSNSAFPQLPYFRLVSFVNLFNPAV